MLQPICYHCSSALSIKYHKKSRVNKIYSIYDCHKCNLWQIYPLPDGQELNKLYQDEYFTQRTERGYNNYHSLIVKKSILSTLKKNLKGLSFYAWENTLEVGEKKTLDIGCAAGHCTEFFSKRGWDALGIDIAESMIDEGLKQAISLQKVDFLDMNIADQTYGLITLWATIEHLPNIDLILQKISRVLTPNGKLYLSTCHIGLWAKRYGIGWRYLNVPEHLWYFSRHALKIWLRKYHLNLEHSFTYGSGYTTLEYGSQIYKTKKRLADWSAKYFHTGDMIVGSFSK